MSYGRWGRELAGKICDYVDLMVLANFSVTFKRYTGSEIDNNHMINYEAKLNQFEKEIAGDGNGDTMGHDRGSSIRPEDAELTEL